MLTYKFFIDFDIHPNVITLIVVKKSTRKNNNNVITAFDKNRGRDTNTGGMDFSKNFKKCQGMYTWTLVNLSYSHHNNSRISLLYHFNYSMTEEDTIA